MASEIAQKNRDYTQELSDMQSQYTKRRRDLINTEQQDIDQIKDNFAKERNQVQASGDAVINHIKKDNIERTDSLQEQKQVQYERQKDENDRVIAGLRKYAAGVEKNTDKQVQEKQQDTEETLQRLQTHQEEVAKHLNDNSKKQYEAYQERVQEAHSKAQAEMDHMVRRASEVKAESLKKNEGTISKMNEQYQTQIENTRQVQDAGLDELRHQGQESVESARHQTAHELEKEQSYEQRRLGETKKYFNEQSEKYARAGERKLQTLKASNEQEMEYERNAGTTKVDRLRTEDERRLEAENKFGETRVTEVKDRTDRQIKQNEAQLQREVSHERKRLDSVMGQMDKDYNTHFQKNKQAYAGNLQKQHEQFSSVYDKNEAANRESFNIQKERLGREIAEAQRNTIDKAHTYAERKDDPFYRLHESNTRIYDTSRAYVLDAEIPHHERNNIKVKIEKDRAVVSGTRKYNDAVQDGDRKVETNNFQTFREEFPFAQPVSNVGIIEEREGDRVRYIIPKLAYSKVKIEA